MCVYRSCIVLSVYERDSVLCVCVCCASICNVSSVYERDSVCVYRSVMSRVFMREIVCVCVVSVCIVLSVYERDSVCVCIDL